MRGFDESGTIIIFLSYPPTPIDSLILSSYITDSINIYPTPRYTRLYSEETRNKYSEKMTCFITKTTDLDTYWALPLIGVKIKRSIFSLIVRLFFEN